MMDDKPSYLLYFWKDGKLITKRATSFSLTTINPKLLNCLVVDTRYSNPRDRYGMYFLPQYAEEEIDTQWDYIPFEDFPEKFKTHLLLLGAT